MNKRNRYAVVCFAAALGVSANAQEQTEPAESAPIPGLTYAMGRSMDPQVMNDIFQLMMTNPRIINNPMAICVQCHDQEAVNRYQTTLMPMYYLMMNPASWMDPNAYTRAMLPMMDPATYTEWYNAWMKMMNQTYTAPPSDQRSNQQ